MEYVPNDVSDATIIALFEVFSLRGMPKDEVIAHKEHNDVAWKTLEGKFEKYIENQSALRTLKYGEQDANNNTCGVIATYNALQFLTNGNAPNTFPELLAHFEESGITMNGNYGTSAHAINEFFENSGYDTKMITGSAGESAIRDLQDNYETYIMLTYNDKNSLNKMVHYVSITCEDGGYVIHNNGQEAECFDTLQEAIAAYNDGNGKPICLIGIGNK